SHSSCLSAVSVQARGEAKTKEGEDMKTISRTFIVVLMLATYALAQVSTSSITGAVTDSSGAVVAGAQVEAKNEETGVVYNTVTTNTGNYSFPSLTPGRYTITVRQTGFRTYTSTDNALTVGA